MSKIFLVACSLILIISCNTSGKREAGAGAERASAPPAAASRADSITAEISIEGTKEAIKMYLLKSPEEFPLGFSTYVPADMRTETGRSGTGTFIRIWAYFGGHSNKDAQVTIYGFPSGVHAGEAKKTAEEAARKVGEVSGDPERYSWADTVFSIKGRRIGFLALGQKQGRWFYLLSSYPPEYGDGMGPRVAMIIRQWRWRDSGASLMK